MSLTIGILISNSLRSTSNIHNLVYLYILQIKIGSEYILSLLNSLPVEILEEMLDNCRREIEIYEVFERHEEVLKTLVLMEYVKIELQVRELEEEMKDVN